MEPGATETRGLQLPRAPENSGSVAVWREPVVLPTYMPEAPERNPMFLEKRVYQGSSGRVYPLPFIDRIATEAVPHTWDAVHLQNEFLRIMVLPEIGGRIHVGQDKINGYDFFYRQNVIKPALVGLAGPWISGGVEFNWPQHHRPATFMPVEIDIERHADGSATVWCSDYDRMSGMKGMHGVCLHPGKAYLELKVRLYNRTPYTQTFLWWANAAVRVHEHYQSFFPPDVQYVADHAKRAVSRFPMCEGQYYGVDYAARARNGVPAEEAPRCFVPDGSYRPNDLSWYANIPVPTSYMIVGSDKDFFGGYDHASRAGVVHVADHHIAPGKKQWTWGNHEFGYAWDRSLTDEDGPYIELMAGVYTDNQPDFSFLAPGETKSFSQYWYPIREIGPPQAANLDAAVSLRVEGEHAHIGVYVTSDVAEASVVLECGGKSLEVWKGPVHVSEPVSLDCPLPGGVSDQDLRLLVSAGGRELIAYKPSPPAQAAAPEPATEPPPPSAVATCDELYLTGLHLEQYRHATRRPESYWEEALRRDPGDSRVNNAMGMWHLRRGEFVQPEEHLRRAIARLTMRNPNPYDGEPFYNLGLTLRLQGQDEAAYDAFYKATWNVAWRGPGYHALAELDSRRGDWEKVIQHLQLSLRVNADDLNVRNLAVVALRRLGRCAEADALLQQTRALDPLDIWSRFLATGECPRDGQQRLELAFDFIRAGLFEDAVQLLSKPIEPEHNGAVPMLLYTLAWCYAQVDDKASSDAAYQRAAQASPDYCFPHRLDELLVLQQAIAAHPEDARAPYYLGNLLYDKRRHREAISYWERAAALDPAFPTAWRNLGVGYFNVEGDAERARIAFDRALMADPGDARVLYERDQLWKRLNVSPQERLAELLRHAALVATRDDLTVELATLYNRLGEPERALTLLTSRKFQPWEGGEGLALAQYLRANLLLGKRALARGEVLQARRFFLEALRTPESLGEAKHLLVNQSELFYWLGNAYAADDPAEAMRWWQRAATQQGDFQRMSVQTVSEATLWSALALERLGKTDEAASLLRSVLDYADRLEKEDPAIDYFATSLPTMLLFDEDLRKRNRITANFLRAQAHFGLGELGDQNQYEEAAQRLRSVLEEDVHHLPAAELLAMIESTHSV